MDVDLHDKKLTHVETRLEDFNTRLTSLSTGLNDAIMEQRQEVRAMMALRSEEKLDGNQSLDPELKRRKKANAAA